MAKEQGLSLLDIGPVSEKVQVGDKLLDVYGVSVKGVFALFARFPEIQQWFKGGRINQEQLIAEAPDTLAAIIAAGCGEPGNGAAEETAGRLPVDTQLDILEAIGRLTFKNGFGPFVKRIVALAAQAQSVNYGRVQDTKSPPVSRPSPPPDTTTKPSGT
jgi:hypothetical protein